MLTWFKKIYQTAIARLQLEQNSEEEPSSGLYDRHAVIEERLRHAMVVNNHRASDIERMEVLCDNVDSYIELLRTVEDALQGRCDFPKEDLSLRLVKVCNFYRSSNGRLTSIPGKRSKMISRMQTVLKVHCAALSVPNPPGWLSYALSRSTTVIVNIDSLSTQLVIPRLGD